MNKNNKNIKCCINCIHFNTNRKSWEYFDGYCELLKKSFIRNFYCKHFKEKPEN